ncbi:transcriptional regulator [Scytonema sp. UIC 10036]|uniref:transcriptional regulator n=1 Tax=Scytonema sp. UIC 10036 TaxID=2304196 RepID=UPI001A9B7E2F|nr:transcriptional regulator [Scytonema sp. UIC 10036]
MSHFAVFAKIFVGSYFGKGIGLTKGNLTGHLSKLEEAGYVKIEKTFRGKLPHTICQLSQKGRKAFETYRQQMQQFIDSTSVSDKSTFDNFTPQDS